MNQCQIDAKRIRDGGILIAFSYLCTFLTIIIMMFKLFFPFSKLSALVIYAIGWVFLLSGLNICGRSLYHFIMCKFSQKKVIEE